MPTVISYIICAIPKLAPASCRDISFCRIARLTLLIAAVAGTTAAPVSGADEVPLDAPAPRIQPDYSELIIPPNIAPLNFQIREPGSAFRVRLEADAGTPVEVTTSSPIIQFPDKAWSQLLASNAGHSLRLDIWIKGADARWKRFQTITNRIAAETIDPVLLYRKLHPVQNAWSTMGLYQRQLQTFKETSFLDNARFNEECCHCHALRNNDPNTATVGIRSTFFGNQLLVINHGAVESIHGAVGYPAWHPNAPIVAAAFSKPRLLLHTAKLNDMRDIIETESWLGYFHLDSSSVSRIPAADNSKLAGSPAWSADGAYLYYCCAPSPLAVATNTIDAAYNQIKYDLMRIAYDVDKDHWGTPELVLSARTLGLSIALPRLSPDGRWLFFCGTAYGCWPVYAPDSDLYGIDLHTGGNGAQFAWRKLEISSPGAVSWLSWSSNSRWVVFSTKRMSPLFSRPHLAYVGADGRCGKPFVLPQRDPTFYDSQLLTYTLPTLATGPMQVSQAALVRAIKNKHHRDLQLPPPK
jgi:hypothetical protein